MCVCMCVCHSCKGAYMYVLVHIKTYAYTRICVILCACMHTSVSTYTRICVTVCVYMHTGVSTYTRICVIVCVYMLRAGGRPIDAHIIYYVNI